MRNNKYLYLAGVFCIIAVVITIVLVIFALVLGNGESWKSFYHGGLSIVGINTLLAILFNYLDDRINRQYETQQKELAERAEYERLKAKYGGK